MFDFYSKKLINDNVMVCFSPKSYPTSQGSSDGGDHHQPDEFSFQDSHSRRKSSLKS